jgi:hypothetical protein
MRAAAGGESQLNLVKTIEGYDGGSTQVGTVTAAGTSQGTTSFCQQPTSACGKSCLGHDAQSYPEADGGHQFAPFLEELYSFKATIETSCTAAVQALGDADVDLRQALNRIWQQLTDLIRSASFVMRDHGMIARDIIFNVSWCLSRSAEEDRLAAQEYFISQVIAQLTIMEKAAATVRASYLQTIEAVKYLTVCAQVTLDFFDSKKGCPEPQVCCKLDACIRELLCLRGLLEDPSDFWLKFHITELELGRIKFAAHQLTKQDVAGSVVVAARRLACFCKDLEVLCLLHLVPRTQHYKDLAYSENAMWAVHGKFQPVPCSAWPC